MRISICTLLVPSVFLLGCKNDPVRPIVPVDPATTLTVYELELKELKKLLPKDTLSGGVTWPDRMFLNSRILLPPADSAHPLFHDQAWLNWVVARGLVSGVCGPAPYSDCPQDAPVAFVSLGVPWTRGGDTVFVGGGYTGLVPNQATSDAIFWLFTVVKSDSGWVVKSKGPPNTMTFVDSATP
jgi:hypothetical protein